MANQVFLPFRILIDLRGQACWQIFEKIFIEKTDHGFLPFEVNARFKINMVGP